MNRHQLPELPYPLDGLKPRISRETLEYHYGKHHAGYVDKLNALIEGTGFESATLEEIVRNASGDLFDNAAQVWNHNFYWQCMSPDGGGEPAGRLAREIDAAFDTFTHFKDKFNQTASANFGSGWTWLTKDRHGNLEIVNTDDADNPMTDDRHALLACDVWEHAYYIDYRNRRDEYLDAFWKLVNWDFVASRATP